MGLKALRGSRLVLCLLLFQLCLAISNAVKEALQQQQQQQQQQPQQQQQQQMRKTDGKIKIDPKK
jgi:hypothetical protein